MSQQYVKVYFSPNRGTADTIIGFIDRCTDTIDAAVYSVTHDGIVDAMIRAHRRGVKIRMLVDAYQAKSKYADDARILAAGIALRHDTQGGAMHNKFIIGDGNAVGTGSFNWSMNADKRNAENFVIIRIGYTIAAFEEEFERLWKINVRRPKKKKSRKKKSRKKTARKKTARKKTAKKKATRKKAAKKKTTRKKTARKKTTRSTRR